MKRNILDINVDFDLGMPEVLQKVIGYIGANDCQVISTTNPYFIMAAQTDPEFKNIINSSVLSLPDGIGVLYAQAYLNSIEGLKRDGLFPIKAFLKGLYVGLSGFLNHNKIGVPLTGVELTYKLCELASKKNYTVFLLGGSPRSSKGVVVIDEEFDMATEAAKVLCDKYPGLKIVGATSSFKREMSDDNKTLEYINSCMARHNINHIDILLVAYNPVEQEKWIHRNAYKIPARVSVGIGRTFDYITNYMPKPPPVYEKWHIAWIYALIKQPWRYKRIFMTFPLFPLQVYIRSLRIKTYNKHS